MYERSIRQHEGLPAATGRWDGNWGEVFGSTRVSPLQEFIADSADFAVQFTTDGDLDDDNLLTVADIDLLGTMQESRTLGTADNCEADDDDALQRS